MDCTATRLPYRQTGVFAKIVTDYIDQSEALKPFFKHPPSISGIRAAIKDRKAYKTNRSLLVDELTKTYGGKPEDRTGENIRSLLSEDTFTITTAHQPNILTGPLYFIYKILHAIRLAEQLKVSIPECNFVPVYYMGCEDADLDELGHIHLNGEKIKWETKQTGAVGRMIVDTSFLQLVSNVEGQLAVMPFGKEILDAVKKFYVKGAQIQDATFGFVNHMFGEYGLVILVPDNAALKKEVQSLFKDDLLHQTASEIVGGTITQIQKADYKVQANPREINLFYLKDAIRERIVLRQDRYQIKNTAATYTETELLKELEDHPECFSPNVILRGIFQEMILPDVAFIGGGGEIGYWLQYSELFAHYNVPFPLLILRNSFLVVENTMKEKISKLGFTVEDFFLSESELLNKLVARESKNAIRFNGSLTQVEQMYEVFKKQAAAVDVSLVQHVDALKTKAVQRLQELEKKMLRAEKRKFEEQQRKIKSIKEKLFPAGGLQERYDNILWYYAKWGKKIVDRLYENSLSLEQEFVILEEKDA